MTGFFRPSNTDLEDHLRRERKLLKKAITDEAKPQQKGQMDSDDLYGSR